MCSIGTKIRKIRELKGYSQEFLAIQLGMSQNNYSRIENNDINVTLSKLQKIAEVLEVNVIKVIAFDEEQLFNNSLLDKNVVFMKEVFH